NAYRLEFDLVRQQIEGDGPQVDYSQVCTALKCDYLALICLLRNSGRDSYSRRERLLALYFRATLGIVTAQRLLKINRPRTVLRLTTILRHFTGVLGEQGHQTQFSNVTA